MATETLEERMTTLENEITRIKRQEAAENSQTIPADWEKIFGSFAGSEGFDVAVRLGREYREAQRAGDGAETKSWLF